MPLTSYVEEYVDAYGQLLRRRVGAFRVHRRAAEHRHRVLGRAGRCTEVVPGRVVTLMRAGPERREWGFWVPELYARRGRRMVPWRTYLGMQ